MFGVCFVILSKIVLCIVLKTEIRQFAFEVDLTNVHQHEILLQRAFSVQSSPNDSLIDKDKRTSPDEDTSGIDLNLKPTSSKIQLRQTRSADIAEAIIS